MAAVTVSLTLGAVPLFVVPPASAGAATSDESPVHGTIWGDPAADKKALDIVWQERRQEGPGFAVLDHQRHRRPDVWTNKDASGRAVTGRGVTVAVVDSGVAAVPGLDAPGKIVRGPDLSLEANSAQVAGVRHVRARHAHGRHHRRQGPGRGGPEDRSPEDRATPPRSSAWRRTRGCSP